MSRRNHVTIEHTNKWIKLIGLGMIGIIIYGWNNPVPDWVFPLMLILCPVLLFVSWLEHA